MNADFILSYSFSDPELDREWKEKAPKWKAKFDAWYLLLRKPVDGSSRYFSDLIDRYIEIGHELDFIEPTLNTLYDVAYGSEFVKFREGIDGKPDAVESARIKTEAKIAPVTHLYALSKHLRERVTDDSKAQSRYRRLE